MEPCLLMTSQINNEGQESVVQTHSTCHHMTSVVVLFKLKWTWLALRLKNQSDSSLAERSCCFSVIPYSKMALCSAVKKKKKAAEHGLVKSFLSHWNDGSTAPRCHDDILTETDVCKTKMSERKNIFLWINAANVAMLLLVFPSWLLQLETQTHHWHSHSWERQREQRARTPWTTGSL